ncbi:535_t:CDS:10 [Diversispora eburnea]|uniref:535_t:CDS:1 n=1 Tax=Diversispora eburnea TaxID=1213867 RepID=A0A9N9AXI1_9GLOM|nr:535_t:CDS:10 [Diversispora eburnea]
MIFGFNKVKEKYGKDIDLRSNEETDESTSEEEDEYGDLITPEVDVQIMKTISAIKSKDPKEEMKSSWKNWLNRNQRKDEKKPIYLKDYQRQILLEDGGDISNEDDDMTKLTKSKLEIPSSKIGLTPVEEERKLKDEFKAAEEEYQNFLLECMAKGNGESVKMWQNYKKNPTVKEDDAFLMDYILNRGWIDKDSTRIPTYEELITEHHDEEEEQFDEAVDNFERSSKITTYSRNTGDSVRRTDNKRVGFNEIDLEEDFDPEKYDQKMSEVFNEEYYTQEVDNEKPEWNDDIDIDYVGNDDVYDDIGNDGYGDDGNFIMDADYLPGERKHHQSEIKEEVKQKFDEYLDEYYQLDYEDIIDGTPVRFKYRQTKPVSFGLTPAEILVADENDLNEFISLKKLAPFRPDNVVNKDIKKYSKKKRIREFRKKLERAEIDNPPENKSWSIKSIKRKKHEAQKEIQEKQKSVKSNKKKKNPAQNLGNNAITVI